MTSGGGGSGPVGLSSQTQTVTIFSKPAGHVVRTIQTGTVFIGKSVNLCYRAMTGRAVRSPGSNDLMGQGCVSRIVEIRLIAIL